jgi:hypothetical protein
LQAGQLQQALVETIRRNKAVGILTPKAVASFAALLLSDDKGVPIYPAAHHWLWLQLMCNPEIKRLLIIGPPESAKTTWALAFMACNIAFHPESNNIIGSIDAETAMKRSMTIRSLVESETWKSLFPDISAASGMKQEQAEWSIARNGVATQGRLHPSMRGYGTGQAIVGSRADLLVGDDLIDYNLSRTIGMRKFVKEWFHNSFLSRLKSGGRVILIGTAWNAADLYADIRQSGEGWVICKTSLLQDGPCYAELYYPDNFIGQMLGNAEGAQ